MEIGKQIKKYRNEIGLSQEQLAERIFVSRQTISNWENDKNYPDIKSLLLLSSLFEISLDKLVKGDLEKMKEQINQSDIKGFRKISNIYAVCLFIMIISAIPLVLLWKLIGAAIWILEASVTLFIALRIEKLKKSFDIQSYREIVAFTEGKGLNETEKVQEIAKRPYQKILASISTGVIAYIISAAIYWFMK